ncbi:sugar dehydrogenase complex small subunit [Gluconacetobacter sacchari]|uniref:sugar dehydrogenase complex small subunit n=1 Tax=Gluconacetobacter sacchari TaxID=92759 RepID=UPI0039B561E3
MNRHSDVDGAEPASHSGMRRRSLMLGTVVAGFSVVLGDFGLSEHAACAATVDDGAFLSVSRAVTGHADLDPIIARRLFAAMRATFPEYRDRIGRLFDLVAQGGSPKEILARSGDLKGDLLALIAAWYTGSVEDRTNAPMVAYDDALMYRPTRDGLPVPTYCFGRPGWWAEPPPPLGIPVRASLPAMPPAPVPQGIESRTPPQTTPLGTIAPQSPLHSPLHSPLPHREL